MWHGFLTWAFAFLMPFGVAPALNVFDAHGGSNDPGGGSSPHPDGQTGPDGTGQTGPDG